VNRRNLFVTGTDTGVGKTVVSAALTLGLEASYWKPIQSGTLPSTDAEQVRAWTRLPDSRILPEAYRLREPASPHAAARAEGVRIDLDRIVAHPRSHDRPIVAEGAGGLLVPLNETDLMVDLIQRLGHPVVLVARTGLGTLNHTLLSVGELRRREIPLLGVVLSGDPHPGNAAAIEHYGAVPVLGTIPVPSSLTPETLLEAYGELTLPPDAAHRFP
jgi:dethiobiotin synthetase